MCENGLIIAQNLGSTAVVLRIKKEKSHPFSPTLNSLLVFILPAVSELEVIDSAEVIWFYHLNLHGIFSHIPWL